MLDNPKETEEIKMRKVKVFSGSSHPQLAQLIFDRLGVQGSPVNFLKQTNGELNISFDCSVREEDVYIIQSGSNAVNDDLMELLIMVNAAKVSSASRITVVMPYLPYSKQSKKKKARGTVVSKLIANMLQTAGVDHIITIDLHSTLIPGTFK